MCKVFKFTADTTRLEIEKKIERKPNQKGNLLNTRELRDLYILCAKAVLDKLLVDFRVINCCWLTIYIVVCFRFRFEEIF